MYPKPETYKKMFTNKEVSRKMNGYKFVNSDDRFLFFQKNKTKISIPTYATLSELFFTISL